MNTSSNVPNIPIWKNKSLKNLPNEIWKDIPNFNGHYQASNLGRIKSVKRHTMMEIFWIHLIQLKKQQNLIIVLGLVE